MDIHKVMQQSEGIQKPQNNANHDTDAQQHCDHSCHHEH
jgi:hypothetical protein